MKIFVSPASYSFNATARTITFTSQIPPAQGLILEVLNVTRGVIYYLPEGGAAMSGTWVSPVLTLTAATTGHTSGDVLRIIVDDGLTSQAVNDAGGSLTVDSSSLASIDGKLPALSSGRLPVDIGSSIEISNDAGNAVPVVGTFWPATQPVSGSVSIAGTTAVSGAFWPETQPVSGTFWQTTQPISAQSLPLPGGAATDAKQDAGNASLASIDAKLPANPATAGNQSAANASLAAIDADLGTDGTSPPALPNGATGVRGWLRLLASLLPPLASNRWPVDGSGVTQPVSLATLLPTVSSVASNASSVVLLAANTGRKALFVMNDSTSVLRLSFATPATSANAFVVIQPAQFLILDPLLIGSGPIYGVWASANGTAQVTEWVNA